MDKKLTAGNNTIWRLNLNIKFIMFAQPHISYKHLCGISEIYTGHFETKTGSNEQNHLSCLSWKRS